MKYLFCFFVYGITLTLTSCTPSEYKEFLLKAHNDLRRNVALGHTPNQPAAANMIEMVWDDDLAEKAESWASSCIAGHDTYNDRELDKFMFVGQNMFAGSDYKDVVQGWYDEFKDYTYEGKGCSAICGHYTQVVWAKSYAVGCAAVNCQEKTSGIFPYGWLFICNYGPAGNFGEEPPYKVGTACSKCPKGTSCKNNLCGNFGEEPPYKVGTACSKCPKGTSCKNNLCALNDPKGSLEFESDEEEDKRKRSSNKRHSNYLKRFWSVHDD